MCARGAPLPLGISVKCATLWLIELNDGNHGLRVHARKRVHQEADYETKKVRMATGRQERHGEVPG